MRFGLRTLLIVLTVCCLCFGYRAYQLRRQGGFVTSRSYHVRFAPDPKPIAKRVRESVSELPAHEITEEELFRLSTHVGGPTHARINVKKWPYEDRFFCRVKLSDGSETHVGFWIYASREYENETVIGCVIRAHDSYLEGPTDHRHSERHALQRRYGELFSAMQQEIERSHWKRLDDGNEK